MTNQRTTKTDPMATAAAVASLVVVVGDATWVIAHSVSASATWVAAGEPLRVTLPVFYAGLALFVLGLLAYWAIRVARGSVHAAHRTFVLLPFLTLFVGGSGLLLRSPSLLLSGAVFGGLFLLFREAEKRLAVLDSTVPKLPDVPRSSDPVRSVRPGDVEAAAAERPYPYPRGLPPTAKRDHLDAVAAWQRRTNPWVALTFVGGVIPIIVTGALGAGRGSDPGGLTLWDTHTGLAFALFVGGLLVAVLGGLGMIRPVRAKYRHMRLLEAYGVRLDRMGNEAPHDPSVR